MTDRADSRTRVVDSLSAYEFQVELNGQPVSGIFSVSGLTSFVGEGALPPLTIAKMVQQDPRAPFNVWTRETLNGDRSRRDVAIVAMDEGVETRRWVYRDATISRISFSDFDTASSELVEERIVIQAALVEELWPS